MQEKPAFDHLTGEVLEQVFIRKTNEPPTENHFIKFLLITDNGELCKKIKDQRCVLEAVLEAETPMGWCRNVPSPCFELFDALQGDRNKRAKVPALFQRDLEVLTDPEWNQNCRACLDAKCASQGAQQQQELGQINWEKKKRWSTKSSNPRRLTCPLMKIRISERKKGLFARFSSLYSNILKFQSCSYSLHLLFFFIDCLNSISSSVTLVCFTDSETKALNLLTIYQELVRICSIHWFQSPANRKSVALQNLGLLL